MAILKSIAITIIVIGIVLYLVCLGLSILSLIKSRTAPEEKTAESQSYKFHRNLSIALHLAELIPIFCASFGIWVMV